MKAIPGFVKNERYVLTKQVAKSLTKHYPTYKNYWIPGNEIELRTDGLHYYDAKSYPPLSTTPMETTKTSTELRDAANVLSKNPESLRKLESFQRDPLFIFKTDRLHSYQSRSFILWIALKNYTLLFFSYLFINNPRRLMQTLLHIHSSIKRFIRLIPCDIRIRRCHQRFYPALFPFQKRFLNSSFPGY